MCGYYALQVTLKCFAKLGFNQAGFKLGFPFTRCCPGNNAPQNIHRGAGHEY